MKTMVYHSGALGDFIQIIPAVKHFRSLHPEVEILFLGKKVFAELGIVSGMFHAHWDIDSTRYIDLFAAPSQRFRTDLSAMDTAIVFACNENPLLCNLKRSGIKKIMHHPPFPSEEIPVAAYHLAMIDPDFNPNLLKEKIIALPPVSGNSFRSLSSASLSNTIIIHPGSGSTSKNWPLEYYTEIGTHLEKHDVQIMWVVGPAEQHLPLHPENNTIVHPPLVELGRALSRCRAYIGNDSGISHLAGAVGCPCLTLFGPTNPKIWKPIGPRVRTLQSSTGSMKDLLPEMVWNVLSSILKA